MRRLSCVSGKVLRTFQGAFSKVERKERIRKGATKALENDRKLITEARQLIDWLDVNDILMNLSEKDITLLMNYMEGHGYQLGINSERLFKISKDSLADQAVAISIDDIIDSVCDWNYEMIQHAKENLEHATGMGEYLQAQEYYNGVRVDEGILDKMFDQTYYGKEIIRLAERLAGEAIQQLQKTGNIDKVSMTVADTIKDYGTEQEKGKVR